MHKQFCEEDRRIGTDPELSAEVGRAADAWIKRWTPTLATMAGIGFGLAEDPTIARREVLYVRLVHLPGVAPPDNFAVTASLRRALATDGDTIARDGSTVRGYWRRFHQDPETPGGINCRIVCHFAYGDANRASRTGSSSQS